MKYILVITLLLSTLHSATRIVAKPVVVEQHKVVVKESKPMEIEGSWLLSLFIILPLFI